MMKKMLLFLMMMGILHADQKAAKVVFDLTTSNMKTFERNVLKGIAMQKAYYEGKLQELEVAVVIHGGAYKFFVKDPKHSPFSGNKKLIEAHPTLKKRIASVAKTYEIEFLMCKAALPRNKLVEKDIYKFVKMVPNSTIGLIDKQNEGFAYIPIRD